MYPSPNNQASSSHLFFTANTIDKFHDTIINTSNNNNSNNSNNNDNKNNNDSNAVVSMDTHNNIDGELTSIDGTTVVTLSNYQTNSNNNVTCQDVLFSHDPYHSSRSSHYESGVSHEIDIVGDDEMEILLSSLINIGSYVPSSV